jgi:hypothetical protein
MTESVLLIFDPSDYVEAKHVVIAAVGASNVNLQPNAEQMRSAPPTPEILVYLAKVGLPALTGLIAFWLGKGKRVIVKVGTRQLNLSNVSDASAEKLVREFLSHVPE